MATDILPPQIADGKPFHRPRPHISSPTSSPLFIAGSTTPPLPSNPKSDLFTQFAEHHENISTTPPIPSPESSLLPSALDLYKAPPFASTPLSGGLSLDEKLHPEDDFNFPNYGSLQYSEPERIEDDSDAPEISTTTSTTLDDSPLPTPTVVDDTAIKQEPSRHVDYLSHNWREEDIWASWRHIVSQRKVYGQKSRLENASWRTWAKSKYRLRTVSPETLNWLKESDVTWLYGPLKPATSHPITSDTSRNGSSQISKSSSFINKKPILKKRSVSEVMLLKSISNSSLIRQAATAVQAQQGTQARPRAIRIQSPSALPSNPPSRDEDEYFPNEPSNELTESPCEGLKEKHIRFDETVEQRIAVDHKDIGFDDSEGIEEDPPNSALSDSSSDDGLFMLNKTHGPRRDSLQKGKLSRSNSTSGQMIETLPSTTLKYRTDSPDVTQEAQQHHIFGKNWSTPTLSPSPSQETIRPTRPSQNFLLGTDDDDDAEADNSSSWSFGSTNPKSSLGVSASAISSNSRGRNEFSYTDGYNGIEGMRRTESGMFMPYDEDEDDKVAAGLFGRVSETINTFRDIGHVIFRSAFS